MKCPFCKLELIKNINTINTKVCPNNKLDRPAYDNVAFYHFTIYGDNSVSMFHENYMLEIYPANREPMFGIWELIKEGEYTDTKHVMWGHAKLNVPKSKEEFTKTINKILLFS